MMVCGENCSPSLQLASLSSPTAQPQLGYAPHDVQGEMNVTPSLLRPKLRMFQIIHTRRWQPWLALLIALSSMMMQAPAPAAEAPELPLRLTTNNLHDLALKDLGEGVYELRTIGTDPYVMTMPLPQNLDVQRLRILSFEYFSTASIDHLQVFTLPPGNEEHSVKEEGLSISEGWSSRAVDLQPALDQPPRRLQALRLDFGSYAGKSFQIRSLALRALTEHEQELQARRAGQIEHEKHLEAALRDYLHRSYPCHVTRVQADEERTLVEGELGSQSGELFVAEAPMFENVTEMKTFPSLEPIHSDGSGKFSLKLKRRGEESGHPRERLLSRWAIVRKMGSGFELLSPAHYTDDIQPKWNLPEAKPRNKKGLGSLSPGRPLKDLDEMDISAVTVNISLSSLMRTSPAEGPEQTSGRAPARVAFQYAGRTWYLDSRALEHLDQTLLEAAKRRLIVSAIILINQVRASSDHAWGKLVAHPDAHPSGIYVMPNVSNEAGLEAYAAALDFLASRYSRPDNQFGRIHHWIMHNEVDAGWEWTNAGEKTALLYLDLYHKSMRAAHLIARQYNAHAKTFISLTHFWAKTSGKHFYPSKELLELLLEFSRVEGDFDWGVAYHPYPEDLRNPRVWADQHVDFTFNTPHITFKNIEVLDAWIKQPANCYLGRRRRSLHLTEQGLNSPDYSERSLQEQAAGMAYTWNKIKHFETIESFHYHNWVDNRGEGGLRIGLRKFPDEKSDPQGPKPIWFVYKALGGAGEEEATAFAKPIIGIRDWSEILFRGPIK